MNERMKRLWGLTIIGAVLGYIVAEFKMVRTAVTDDPAPPTNPIAFSLRDWKQALRAIKDAFGNKNLPILAASVAYFSILAFFPMMAAAVAIAALAIEPEQLQSVVDAVDTYLPRDVAGLITTQLENLTGRQADNIAAVVIAIALSLFGASGASKSLVTAANVAYGVKEPRGWLRQQVRGLGWTVVGILFGFIIAVLLVINESVLRSVGVISPLMNAVLYSRWAIIIILITVGLAFFYRYGPNRHHPKWQWISWGALTATVLWLAATSLFFVYVQNFGNYGRSYSLFAGVIILMIWLNLSAFTVLLGAAVNHALEKAARAE